MALGRFYELLDVGRRLAAIETTLASLERMMCNMATRAEFDALKAELKQDIATIVQSVKGLQAQLAAGEPITDQDLADLQDDINTLTGGAPVPDPRPRP